MDAIHIIHSTHFTNSEGSTVYHTAGTNCVAWEKLNDDVRRATCDVRCAMRNELAKQGKYEV